MVECGVQNLQKSVKAFGVLQDPKRCHKNKHHSKEHLNFQNTIFYSSKCFSFSGREILSVIYADLAEIRPYVLMVSAELGAVLS